MTPNSSHVTQQKYIYTGDDENLYGKAFYSQASASAKLWDKLLALIQNQGARQSRKQYSK